MRLEFEVGPPLPDDRDGQDTERQQGKATHPFWRGLTFGGALVKVAEPLSILLGGIDKGGKVLRYASQVLHWHFRLAL